MIPIWNNLIPIWNNLIPFRNNLIPFWNSKTTKIPGFLPGFYARENGIKRKNIPFEVKTVLNRHFAL